VVLNRKWIISNLDGIKEGALDSEAGVCLSPERSTSDVEGQVENALGYPGGFVSSDVTVTSHITCDICH